MGKNGFYEIRNDLLQMCTHVVCLKKPKYIGTLRPTAGGPATMVSYCKEHRRWIKQCMKRQPNLTLSLGKIKKTD